MPDTIVCSKCQHEVARDLWEDHHCLPLGPRPRLEIAGFLLRVEGDRVTVTTLAPGVFGHVIVCGRELVSASFARHDLGKFVSYLLTQIEEQGE